jgi:hypothetical protein
MFERAKNVKLHVCLVFHGDDRLCGLVVWVPGYRCRDPWFDSRRYQVFWEVVLLERGPLSLLSTVEEVLGRKSSGSCPENREYSRRDPLRWPRNTLYPQKLALTSPTSGGRLVGIVPSRTKTTEFSLFLWWWLIGGRTRMQMPCVEINLHNFYKNSLLE